MGTPRKSNELTKENNKIYENNYGQDIISDGNCFYRCLSKHFFGHQQKHEQIRQEIIQYMSDGELLPKAEKINRYRKIMRENDDYDLYLTLHSEVGKWADDPIIQASADKYCLYIFVYSKYPDDVQRLIAKPVQPGRKHYMNIILKLENYHFTLIAKDQHILTGKWFDLLCPLADGPEQYDNSSLALDYNKCFTSKPTELELDVVSDGNSFQRCLSYFLNGDQQKHDQIRMEIIKFMSGDDLLSKADKLKRYGQLMDENDDYDSYLALHSQNGELAEDPIIQAGADRYDLDIFVYFYRNSNCIQRIRARPLQPRRDNLKIFLRFENYRFTFAKEQFEFPEEVWFDLLFPLADGPEELDEHDSLDLDNCKNIIFMETEEATDFKNLKDKMKITKELKKKWNFKADEEPTGDVNHIANLIANENLPGTNGSA